MILAASPAPKEWAATWPAGIVSPRSKSAGDVRACVDRVGRPHREAVHG